MSNSKNEVIMPKDSMFGITVQTWGTESRSSNGMMAFTDRQFFGGNVGHASVNMKLPVTTTTKEWIETCCYKQTYDEFKKSKGHNKTYEEYLKEAEQIIPVSLKTQVTRAAKYDSSGNVVATHDTAYKQTYFDIDWSWWPEKLQTTEEDYVSEREGRHFEYDDELKEILKPEQRIHQGTLGQRKMDYAPFAIIHQRDVPASELNRITREHGINKIEAKLETVELLNTKIKEMKSTKLTPSMVLMFKNLDMDIEQILNESKTSELDVDIKDSDKLKKYLADCVLEKKTKLEQDLREIEKKTNKKEDNTKIKDTYNDLNSQLNRTSKQVKENQKLLENIEQQLYQNPLEPDKGKLEQQRDKIKNKIESLKADEERLRGEIEKVKLDMIKIREFSEFYTKNASAYMVIGLPPDHQVSLPLAVNGDRGLHPLAMLQKMKELVVSPDTKKFSLETNNCSNASIEVLSAGAAHDPLLQSILSERALGFFGTPQQVLENVKSARAAIDEGTFANFLTPITNAKPLDKALGYAMGIYMDPNASRAKQNAGLVLGALIGIAKLPGIIISSLVNPKESFNDLMHTLNLVYERDSTGLKIGLTLLAAPILLVIAPLAASANVRD